MMSLERIFLDTRNLLCPLPLIRLQDCTTRLTGPALIEMKATDPGVLQDIPMWCQMYGHTILKSVEDENTHEITLLIHAGTTGYTGSIS